MPVCSLGARAREIEKKCKITLSILLTQEPYYAGRFSKIHRWNRQAKVGENNWACFNKISLMLNRQYKDSRIFNFLNLVILYTAPELQAGIFVL